MTVPLLRSRRFLPLFLAQGLGAFNDNLFKNALVVLVVFRVADAGAALTALAGGLFILPYALFSAVAGQLADRFDKSRLIRVTKLFEVALMMLAAIALILGNIPALFAVLFGLGTQAAFFGPLKYGILPDHLPGQELLRGNALIEAATFAAILLGTIAGGALIGLDAGPQIVAGAGLIVAAAGAVAAFLVPRATPAAPGLQIGWNIATETLALIRAARADRAVWLPILGLSWFWTIGATFLAEFPVLAKLDFQADNRVVTLLLAGFAVGVGAGSILAGRLLQGEVSARHVPMAALLLSAFTAGFAVLAGQPWASGWNTPAAMLADPAGLAAVACLLGAAACGGVFSVPLYALVQDRADPAQRARMIAANNVLNAAFMVAGAVVITALAAAGMRPTSVLLVAAVLNLGVAGYSSRALPGTVQRAGRRAT
ncbi:MAG: MFS transporter [Gemmatimonadaceae bacterium]|nr:MFS transporter [Acetobacteraceae bacterium]